WGLVATVRCSCGPTASSRGAPSETALAHRSPVRWHRSLVHRRASGAVHDHVKPLLGTAEGTVKIRSRIGEVVLPVHKVGTPNCAGASVRCDVTSGTCTPPRAQLLLCA